ncbi:MAG: hypothetical protein R3F11_15395 [Verrucomicrobiales bacterium]
MNPTRHFAWIAAALVIACPARAAEEADAERIADLDRYWAEVSRSVGEGDFDAYRATCHEEGILVSGIRGKSTPLSEALARWKKEFDDTKAGHRQSSVAFRFSKRIGGDTTAHETGIFRYSFREAGGEPSVEFIHFEALLTKVGERWLILMEYQKAIATDEEWAALAAKRNTK